MVGFPATPLLLARVRICISASHTREDLVKGLEVRPSSHQYEMMSFVLGVLYSFSMHHWLSFLFFFYMILLWIMKNFRQPGPLCTWNTQALIHNVQIGGSIHESFIGWAIFDIRTICFCMLYLVFFFFPTTPFHTCGTHCLSSWLLIS